MKNNIFVKVVKDQKDLDTALGIRTEVFVKEQGVPIENEVDEYEKTAEHILVYFEEKPVGTARWRCVDDFAKIERVCVLPSFRKYGLGKVIMESLERLAIEKDFSKLKLHGQVQASEFYLKLGYEKKSEIFLEEGIEHVVFTKQKEKSITKKS